MCRFVACGGKKVRTVACELCACKQTYSLRVLESPHRRSLIIYYRFSVSLTECHERRNERRHAEQEQTQLIIPVRFFLRSIAASHSTPTTLRSATTVRAERERSDVWLAVICIIRRTGNTRRFPCSERTHACQRCITTRSRMRRRVGIMRRRRRHRRRQRRYHRRID